MSTPLRPTPVTDDVALGGGLNATTWFTPGANVYSAELEGLLRVYPYHGPFFLDLTAGFQQATGNIPQRSLDRLRQRFQSFSALDRTGDDLA